MYTNPTRLLDYKLFLQVCAILLNSIIYDYAKHSETYTIIRYYIAYYSFLGTTWRIQQIDRWRWSHPLPPCWTEPFRPVQVQRHPSSTNVHNLCPRKNGRGFSAKLAKKPCNGKGIILSSNSTFKSSIVTTPWSWFGAWPHKPISAHVSNPFFSDRWSRFIKLMISKEDLGMTW